jgi:hypothetical protein
MRISPSCLTAAVSLLIAAPAALAQPPLVGPPAPTAPKPKCVPSAPDAEEIVVCGERYDEDSPYRIPRELRERGQIDQQDQSWDARVRDLESLDQYGSQTVGPFGYMQNSRQRDCEYRADRQRAQGRQIDCTRKLRPDDPADWQRR